MSICNDNFYSIFDLILEHNKELENNLAYCDDIAIIKSRLDEDSLTEINILDELKVKEPDTSRIFACLLKSKKNVILTKFINDYLRRIGFTFEVKNPIITAEKKYRIDILIEDIDYAIIIENKLHGAVYQRNQLARYIKQIENRGYKTEQIFIVIIPDYYYDTYLSDIRRSVWKLPTDWKVSNKLRKCSWYDEYCCQCDNGSDVKYEENNCHNSENNCIDYKNLYEKRTVVIDNGFPDWLTECTEHIDKNEILLQSVLVQLSDYIKIRYNQKQSEEYIMEMKEFLRAKLIDDNNDSEKNWNIVNEKISQIEDMKRGLEALQQDISKCLINKWRDNLKAMGWNLFYEDKKSFGININGIWCGCWSGCESGSGNGNLPFWGFYSDSTNIEDSKRTMIEDILNNAGLMDMAEKGHNFIFWNSTFEGDKICNQLYTSAKELGYIG